METTGQPPALRAYCLPFYAPGHLLPLVDLAILLSARGVDSTVLATPSNADMVRATVERAAASGLPIRVLLYPFPSAAVGLPPGCESISSAPASDEPKLIQATSHARDAVEPLLRLHRPDFVVADPYFKWAPSAARDLGIPLLSYSTIPAFTVAVMVAAMTQGIDDSVGDDVPFVVAGLPDPPIRLTKSELPLFLRTGDDSESYKEGFEAADVAYGLVINSFSALEQRYLDHSWKESIGKVWCVGPVGLFKEAGSDSRAPRGGGEDETNNAPSKCLEWLDSQKPSSVVYICFGTCCHFKDEQLHELALGLEESEHPFLWVVRDESEQPPWLPEGYKARVEGKGLIVQRWTPQVPILNHPSVGVFMTHCGWNSSLEAVSAGVPLLTWPLVFEQFITEKLLVDVLRIGSKVWDGFRSALPEEKVLVPRQAIAEAVKGFMGGDREEIGRRAKEYSEKARSAVGEGGSSYNDIDNLIEDMRRQSHHLDD